MPIEAGEGGAAGESGSVVPGSVTSRDTILVQPGGGVVDAATISAIDGIYGIAFSFTLPKTQWQTQIIKVSASNYASYIQQIGGHDHVVAAWYAPDTNAAGILIDTLVVVVQTDDGTSSAEVEIPFSMLNTPAAFNRIDAAYGQLVELQAIA
jgi:hypothetical protein